MSKRCSSGEEGKNSGQRRNPCAEAQEYGESLVLTGDHGDLPVGHTRRSECKVARDEIKSSKIHRDSKDVDRSVNSWVTGV